MQVIQRYLFFYSIAYVIIKFTGEKMSLVEKLSTIDRPRIESFQNGTAETIKEFYESFIEPRLPQNIEHVIKWHKVLKEYVKKENNVLGFRTGNVRGSLRRGWETITNDNYSFFYTDNFFAHYFFKLALDADWEPNLDEFYNAMVSKTFPVRFKYHNKTKDDPHAVEYASFNIEGQNPGLNMAGYKLAHVIDAGKNYSIDHQIYGMAKIIKTYFNIGTPSDWELDPSTNKYCRKDFIIPEEKKVLARKIAEACFLRMIHPMNYFLSPKSPSSNKKKENLIYNTYLIGTENKYDIAEEKLLISYVRQRFHERYTVDGVDYFQDFLDLVYSMEDEINENGSSVINLTYSKEPLLRISESGEKKEQSPRTNNSRQTHKFVFNNTTYNLRQLGLAVVKYYVEQNPDVTFEQLRQIFDIRLNFNRKPLIRRLNELTEKEHDDKRVFLDSPITLQDDVAYVSTQWSYGEDFPRFQEILNDLHYEVQEV